MTPPDFEIARHNDYTYKPPHPWTKWDADAPCWVCFSCGAAAGYQMHNPQCSEERSIVVTFTRMELAMTITSLRERFSGGSQTADRLEGLLRIAQGFSDRSTSDHPGSDK